MGSFWRYACLFLLSLGLFRQGRELVLEISPEVGDCFSPRGSQVGKKKNTQKKVYQHYGLNPQLGIPLGEDQLVSIPRKQSEDHVERSRIIPLN